MRVRGLSFVPAGVAGTAAAKVRGHPLLDRVERAVARRSDGYSDGVNFTRTNFGR
jgi:hypothetical protein